MNHDDDVKFLDVTRPTFTTVDAERLARDLYGIAAKAKEFYSERDRVFHLKADDGREHVLKLVHPDEDEATLDFQIQALNWIAREDPALALPRVIHNKSGRQLAHATDASGRPHAVWMLDFLPGVPLMEAKPSPQPLRELRRVLRYRNLLVRQAVRMANRLSGLLMETGTPYNQRRLRGRRYYEQLLTTLEVPESVRELLQLSRSSWELFQGMQKRLLRELLAHRQLQARVERLQSIPGVGAVTALTWALEVGEPSRFGRVAQACSYAGLTPAQRQSADREHRGPLSKQRNRHLQTVLIEAAKLAPRWNLQLAAVHERELQRGNRNRATLVVARKLVAYLLAVDRSGQAFQLRAQPQS